MIFLDLANNNVLHEIVSKEHLVKSSKVLDQYIKNGYFNLILSACEKSDDISLQS